MKVKLQLNADHLSMEFFFIYFHLQSTEPDSGIDATTVTTSTLASTATSSTTGSARPSRSAKTKASGNLVRFCLLKWDNDLRFLDLAFECPMICKKFTV